MQMFGASGYPHHVPICGLYYNVPLFGSLQKTYLPQVEVKVHARILATTSRTVLQQTFVNPSTTRGIREVRYAFPLYNGVSVVGFSCHVGNRLITGEVKEKEKAKEVYNDAIAQGETAGLLEQLPEASDVFTTTIGNIPPSARVVINITYLGELKHDMEVDGIRFTIPTSICPRYGNVQGAFSNSFRQMDGTISITVDAEMAEGSFIQKLQSPSHPISMSIGTTSTDPDAVPSMSRASATLSLAVAHLDTDFILQVIAKDTGVPKAILETHPTIPNHRALMATLVPKFALPPEKPEIVFVCDQSGSMRGDNITLAREALQVFLKSLPVGVKFNICSFGSGYSFLFPRSASYGQDTLADASRYAERLEANYGGTEMLPPIKATIENRYKDIPLDIILLTDGGIWNQQDMFDYLNEQILENKAPIRVFTLGIGSGVSHSLIEGVANAGNGFSQSVQGGEKMNSKVVRMLKGALSPHVTNYTLEVKYSATEKDNDFEIIEKVADSLKVKLDLKDKESIDDNKHKKPVSLFDTTADLDQAVSSTGLSGEERYAHLPPIPGPKIIQAPQSIPTLFAFNRTTIYLLLGPDAPLATPTSVVLRGTSSHGPLELEIAVQGLAAPGETIHQLAAKKAVSELEQGRGWLASASDLDGQLLKKRFDGRFSEMVEREAVRLGVHFQVGGKWCSFVATEKTSATSSDKSEQMEEDWEFLEDEQPSMLGGPESSGTSAGRVTRAQQVQLQRLQPQQQQQQQICAPARQQTSQASVLFAAAQVGAPARKKRLQRSDASASGPASSLFGMSAGVEALPHQSSGGGLFGSSNAPPAIQSPQNSSGGLFGGMCDFDDRMKRTSTSPIKKPAFGAVTSNAAAASPFGAPSAYRPSAPAAQAFGAAPSASGNALQDYQMGLMLCEQQSRSRRTMARIADTGAMGKRRQPTQPSLFMPTAEAHESYSPTSPSYSPVSPGSAPASPAYAPSPPFAAAPSSPDTQPSAPEASPPRSPQEVMHLLITHQSFSGTFPYSPTMLSWLGISLADFRHAVQDACGGASEQEGTDLLTTALAIVYLERKARECKDEWELVVDKARDWLEGELHGKGGVDGVLKAAEKLIVG